jgi:hypothetical protein
MKQRNPSWGCPRIAQQIALAFHIQIEGFSAITTGRDSPPVVLPG